MTQKCFNEIANEKKGSGESQEIMVYASDIDPETVRLAMRHAQNAGVLKKIKFQTCHFNDFVPPPAPGIIIINPPYGERIVQHNLNELYTQIGDRFKKEYAGYEAWIISANAEAVKHVGLRPSAKIPVL